MKYYDLIKEMYFEHLNMPINVFGKSLSNSKNKIDTGLIVQKPFLRSSYLEINTEGDIDWKNQYRIKTLPDPTSIREATIKNYVHNKFKNDIDFNDVKIENNKFVKVNCQPAVIEHLITKIYVEKAIDQPTLMRNNQNNDFNNYNLTNKNSNTLNTQAVKDNQVITKAYVDQFHQENERSRRQLGIGFYDESGDLIKNNQDNDFNDNKLTNLD